MTYPQGSVFGVTSGAVFRKGELGEGTMLQITDDTGAVVKLSGCIIYVPKYTLIDCDIHGSISLIGATSFTVIDKSALIGVIFGGNSDAIALADRYRFFMGTHQKKG